ncbi:MAG TPA: hypothetical protein VFV38_48800 [Ktedonobacteraceae bacterium]|nr:hypothetical protein [Ktedonobacteraceae bacterium]
MKRRRGEKRRQAPFAFTLETLTLTEEAIKLFEQPLQRGDQRDARVLFAKETMQRIKEKLGLMKKSVGLLCMVSFDYNEKILLIQTLRLYSFALLSLPWNARQAREVQHCQRIAAYFEEENARAELRRLDD